MLRCATLTLSKSQPPDDQHQNPSFQTPGIQATPGQHNAWENCKASLIGHCHDNSRNAIDASSHLHQNLGDAQCQIFGASATPALPRSDGDQQCLGIQAAQGQQNAWMPNTSEQGCKFVQDQPLPSNECSGPAACCYALPSTCSTPFRDQDANDQQRPSWPAANQQSPGIQATPGQHNAWDAIALPNDDGRASSCPGIQATPGNSNAWYPTATQPPAKQETRKTTHPAAGWRIPTFLKLVILVVARVGEAAYPGQCIGTTNHCGAPDNASLICHCHNNSSETFYARSNLHRNLGDVQSQIAGAPCIPLVPWRDDDAQPCPGIQATPGQPNAWLSNPEVRGCKVYKGQSLRSNMSKDPEACCPALLSTSQMPPRAQDANDQPEPLNPAASQQCPGIQATPGQHNAWEATQTWEGKHARSLALPKDAKNALFPCPGIQATPGYPNAWDQVPPRWIKCGSMHQTDSGPTSQPPCPGIQATPGNSNAWHFTETRPPAKPEPRQKTHPVEGWRIPTFLKPVILIVARVAEATHPGPIIGTTNPCGALGKAAMYDSLPGDKSTPRIWGLAETHLTKPGLDRFRQELKHQKTSWRIIHGNYAEPVSQSIGSIGGRHTGVAVMSNCPIRALPTQWDDTTWTTSRVQACAVHVQSHWIKIGTFYGYAKDAHTKATKERTDSLLQALTDRIVIQARGFRAIVGDFNATTSDLEQFAIWEKYGFREFQEIAAAKWNRPIQNTCHNKSVKDHVWISPELIEKLEDVQVDTSFFPDHAIVYGKFEEFQQPLPTPIWYKPHPIPWDRIPDDHVWPIQALACDSFQEVFQRLEAEVDTALMDHQQPTLLTCQRGRGTVTAPKMIRHSITPLRRSRKNEVQVTYMRKLPARLLVSPVEKIAEPLQVAGQRDADRSIQRALRATLGLHSRGIRLSRRFSEDVDTQSFRLPRITLPPP